VYPQDAINSKSEKKEQTEIKIT